MTQISVLTLEPIIWGSPRCSDDNMIFSISEQDVSAQLRIIDRCYKKVRVDFNNKKTEILLINKKNKKPHRDL